jgi:hypothetical protein
MVSLLQDGLNSVNILNMAVDSDSMIDIAISDKKG